MKLFARRPGDLLFGAGRKQAPGEARDGRVARGMGGGEASLRANARSELASDERDDQQDDHCHNVGDPVHPEAVDRRGEEKIVGERRGDPRDERRTKAPQCGGGEHRWQIDHVDRRRAPARRDPHPEQR